MIVRVLLCTLALAIAQVSTAAADPLSYDDPGMHYQAPAGWERLDLGDATGKEDSPAAVFTIDKGKVNARSVIIQIKPFDGSLNEFVSNRRGELRQGSDNVTIFINKQQPVTLANGMPAFLIEASSNSDSAPSRKSYEYLIIDGQRSIDVTYSGLVGDINDDGGKATLSSLYVVAYPKRP
jgi:hypothetical protein